MSISWCIGIFMCGLFFGVSFQKWDAKYGAVYGKKLGKWTREHVFRLLPFTGDNHEQR